LFVCSVLTISPAASRATFRLADTQLERARQGRDAGRLQHHCLVKLIESA
jgi:hypothetical protein